MSLTLEESKIDVKTFSGPSGRGLMDNEIRIGDHYVKADEFAEAVMYFMTNTDLDYSDVRKDLKKRIQSLRITEGFNGSNERFEQAPRASKE